MSAREFAPVHDSGTPMSPTPYEQSIGPRSTSAARAFLSTLPKGLGTSAARAFQSTLPEVFDDELDEGYVDRSWGDGSGPPLYLPAPERIDTALGDLLDARVGEWGTECGFDKQGSEELRDNGFGRLAMLAHPDSDDPDQLMIAAWLNAAWWAADDRYADDTDKGALPEKLPPRLMVAMMALDPLAPVGEFDPPLAERIRSEPVLAALQSGVRYLAERGTPAQVQRACYASFAMFVSWTAYAAWRHTENYPPAWEYLAARQHDSFFTSMTLVDPVGGYELPANVFYDPDVRRLANQAGLASVVLNDLVSVTKDAADAKPLPNMVLQIAADRHCSLSDATEITVELHNQLVRDFRDGHRRMREVPLPELQRFLNGVRAWMGGGAEWHITAPRYR
ncbi:family 2 encapsulin nanocompartment cargo protein terpene cyclase [Nocardia sp. NBC_01499]|uniref:family 2 encapsulin nanocompartment cargo protein terpene cyclase n=1 Tax=Nocardia sp. NBC_01499 TaxID=2903597 RepID=UPI00386FF9B0